MASNDNHDAVEHPKHYTGHPSGIECIQITEHMNFCLGNAVKYLWRCGQKNDALEDLRKARWYIDREIERLTASPTVEQDEQAEREAWERFPVKGGPVDIQRGTWRTGDVGPVSYGIVNHGTNVHDPRGWTTSPGAAHHPGLVGDEGD